jgi:hypothetical protein
MSYSVPQSPSFDGRGQGMNPGTNDSRGTAGASPRQAEGTAPRQQALRDGLG